MGKNHRNRSWRGHWSLDPDSREATHKSGIKATVVASADNPDNDRITLVNTDVADTARWNIGKVTEQAIKLWMEGSF